MRHPATATLRSIEYFKNLSEASLEKLTQLSEIKPYKANSLIISQGATSRNVAFIVSGFVKLMRGDRQSAPTQVTVESENISSKRMLIDLLAPGDSIGAASALLGVPYSSSAIALTPCNIVLISSEQFETLLYEISGLSEIVMSALAKNLIESEKHVQLMNGDLKTPVHAIRERCEKMGIEMNKWISNAEVARMAGATRVAVNQIMNRHKDRTKSIS